MKSAAVLSLLVLLGACGRDATVYPSLARRPIESIDLSRPPAAKEAPLVADRALDARIAGFRQDLGRIASGFDAAAARAGQLAGAAAARRVGSEAWLDAQTALGALDDWRAQTTDLVGRIDAAASERAAQLAPPYPALEGIQQAAAAEAERQDAARRPIQDTLPAA